MDHVHVFNSAGHVIAVTADQVLGVGLCRNCGKLISFNPDTVPTIDDAPLCRECVDGHINPARRTIGRPEIHIDDDAYEAGLISDLPTLRLRLSELKEAHEQCSYIDHYPDVVRCREQFQPLIDRVAQRIAELEGQDNAA